MDVIPKIECWFLDVGQGASNVILLGGRRAIVIDGGPRGSTVPLQLLKRHVETIELLVITHNDEDHDGGVARILANFPRAVKQIYFLVDRPASSIKTYRLAQLERARGRLLCEPKRLEMSQRPKLLFADSASRIQLRLLYPSLMENMAAEQDVDRHNRTSGILVLLAEKRKVVFSGDANISAWESLAARMPHLPLTCDIMTAPHHGGLLTGGKQSPEDHENNARRLFAEIIRPETVIISVGSANDHRHPRAETLAVLRDVGTRVVCTQMTPRCCSGLEAVRPCVMDFAWPSQSSRTSRLTRTGRSKDVACAGSVVAEISPDAIEISVWEEHQATIQQLVTGWGIHPVCRG